MSFFSGINTFCTVPINDPVIKKIKISEQEKQSRCMDLGSIHSQLTLARLFSSETGMIVPKRILTF